MIGRERRIAAEGGNRWSRAISRYIPVLPPHAAGSFSPGIHGARGLFAFLVVIYHAANSGMPVWSMPDVAHQGLMSLKFGVELFFAISGFVIIGTLGRSRTAWQFLLNRATRIYSVLWVLLPVFVVISLVSGRGRLFDLSETEFVLVFIGNMFTLGPLLPIPVLYGPAWTLCYEFTFYFLCFLFLFGRQYLKADLRLPLIALGLVVIATQPRTMFFLSGVVVASGLLDRRLPRWLFAEPAVWVVTFLVLWQSASADSSPFFRPVYEWDGPQWALGLGAPLAATLAIQGIAEGRGLLGRFVQLPFMLWLGTISYSLYLWHLIPMGAVKAAMYKLGIDEFAGPWSQLLLLLLTLPPTFIMAALSQHLLENRLATWLRRRLGGSRPSVSPATVH